MTKRKKKVDFEKVRGVLPYFLVAVGTIAVAAVGSIGKYSSGSTLSMDAFAKENYKVSVDQMTELYTVADLSDALNLASADDVAINYVTVTSMYASGQTSSDKLEYSPIVDFTVSKAVKEYTVSEGETMAAIARAHGITTDQIRWSNGLKTTDLAAGKVLYLPTKSGIVYTVKTGDTVASIVAKYGGTREEIDIYNGLDGGEPSVGMKILIAGGTLPEKERPEYVAPVRTYTYLGDTSERIGVSVVGYYRGLGGPYVAGQCTQWAWYKRQDLPSNLGNANKWAANARAAGYRVDRIPSAGAVFQTPSGWYGHVGYVEAVNPDGSIVVTEMNYGHISYRVVRSTIPANKVANFNYIHRK